MQISELAQGVAAKLEQSRIVFWYDPEQSFTEELEHLANALSIAKEVGDSAADITARVLRTPSARGSSSSASAPISIIRLKITRPTSG